MSGTVQNRRIRVTLTPTVWESFGRNRFAPDSPEWRVYEVERRARILNHAMQILGNRAEISRMRRGVPGPDGAGFRLGLERRLRRETAIAESEAGSAAGDWFQRIGGGLLDRLEVEHRSAIANAPGWTIEVIGELPEIVGSCRLRRRRSKKQPANTIGDRPGHADFNDEVPF